jgi:adenylate kinase family enzyme
MLKCIVQDEFPTVVVAIMGPTCAGKSTLLERLKAELGDRASFVEVGKMLRAKYPPEYFQGQNNPKHTAQEAWDLCVEGIDRGRREGRAFVFVDGQPRDIPQTDAMVALGVSRYLLLTCSIEESENRARASRSGADLETLALPRIRNDRVAYYEVLMRLNFHGKRVDIVYTDTTPEAVFSRVRNRLVIYAASSNQ